ncbi:MAG: SCO family protein [Flavobacterium sp.]|nr:SCO family protein [Pedobacter sp.]
MKFPSFPIKKVVVLVIMLAVPGILYYLLQEKGKNRYKPLGFFGPKELASSFHTKRGKKIQDTLYHTIRPFSLPNQDNILVKFPADSAQITVVNFFFTRCTSFCKAMNNEVARVNQIFGKNRLVRFYSISVDPEYDNPKVLLEYSKKFDEKYSNWQFLSGKTDVVYRLAKEDFLVDALKDTTEKNNFIHSPMLILVDPQKRIRGYYDSANKEDVDRLSDEIKLLITEELRNVKDR